MSIFKKLFGKKLNEENKSKHIEFERFTDDNSFSFASEILNNTNTNSNISDFETAFVQHEKEKMDLILAAAKRKTALETANGIKNSTRKQYKKVFAKFEKDGMEQYVERNNSRTSITQLQSALKKIDEKTYKTEIEQLQRAKHKKTYRVTKYKDIKLRSVLTSISQIKDKKLQAGYKMMVNTGIRVSTLGGLERRDITLKDGRILVKVRFDNNKTCREITITALEDNDLYQYLENRLSELNDNDKVFYIARTYQKHCRRLKFDCHDLRSINAQINLYTYSKDMDEVKTQLGHSKYTNTDRYYIKSKNINFYGTKYNF